MIERAYNDSMSLFGGAFCFALRIVSWIVFALIWAAISILRVVLPFVLFGIVLLGKGLVLFVVLLLVTFWTYWRNIGILRARIQAAHGMSESIREIQLYCHASQAELRFQDDPFSVVSAVEDTLFYRRFIAFVDVRHTDQITIQNIMSLGWIAQVLDSGLTRIVKLSMPLAIYTSNVIFVPLHMVASLFD